MKAPALQAQHAITRILEPGVTIFSSAEIHVAVAPIGDVPQAVLEQYYALITKHRQVELQSIQPFYKAQQKSPFKAFPWKTGSMHFRFLPEKLALQPSPLTALHAHRKILGIIGICHCPAVTDLAAAYNKFDSMCKQFPGALTQRCFAFQPSDEQMAAANRAQDKRDNLMMFPPTEADGLDQLDSHASFLMLEFAAALLGELENWMLRNSPGNASSHTVDLATFADTSDKFLESSSVVEEVQKRLYTDEEMVKKRRHGRMMKANGDFSLLAGSPADAVVHYMSAADVSRTCNDSVWCAGALLGAANAKVLESCLSSGAMRSASKGDNGESSPTQASRQWARLRAASQVSMASSGFGGQQFWEALRESDVEREVRALYLDAKVTLRRKGAFTMQVEADLALARLLAGLHGTRMRREISEMMSNVMEIGVAFPLIEDRLTSMMEVAQVLGLIGSARKRTLILWQAVEFSRAHDRATPQTLQIARKALEPPDDPREGDDESELLVRRKPLSSGVPQHWGSVRCACIEGVLSTAILSRQHAEVWDAAALLLREHWQDLPAWRQHSLVQTLEAASSQMQTEERLRPGPGPPPLITFVRAMPPPPHLQPRLIPASGASKAVVAGLHGPFIYNPATAKERERELQKAVDVPAQWISGEVAVVEVEIRNPTTETLTVDKVELEAEHVVDPSVAPSEHGATSSWRTMPFNMSLPPRTHSFKVLLTGIPLEKGLYTVTGCNVTCSNVSWHQPWSPAPPTLASIFKAPSFAQETGGRAEARVTVAEALPLLEAVLQAPSTSVTPELVEPARAPTNAISEWSPAPQPVHVTALKGQVLKWLLVLENAGKMPVLGAMVTAEQVGGSRGEVTKQLVSRDSDSTSAIPGGSTPRAPTRSPPLSLHLDQARLAAQLPLKRKHRALMPVLIHCPLVAAFNMHEEATLDFRIAYHSSKGPSLPSTEAGEGPAVSDPLGRCIPLPATIHFLPSLQINSLIFFEHHEAPSAPLSLSNGVSNSKQRSHLASPTSEPSTSNSESSMGSACRRCIVELDILNRAPVALQVWIGERVAPALKSLEWDAVVNSPRPWQPGGTAEGDTPATVACKIIPAHSTAHVAAFADLPAAWPASSAPDPAQGPASSSGRRAKTQPGREVAEELCARMAMFWRREDLHDESVPLEIGSLPLPVDTVERALNLASQCLALLRPSPVSISFFASAAVGADRLQAVEEQLLVASSMEVAEGQPRRGAVWGTKATLGQPLHLTMQVFNGSSVELNMEASLACHTAEYEADLKKGMDDPNVLPCGTLIGVSIKAEPGEQVSHAFAVCFLYPGLYTVYAYDIYQRKPADTGVNGVAAATPSPSVRPIFVLVD